MTFGEKLTGLRKREGLSQEALAEQLGVSRQAVSRWEQGAALPDAAKLLPCAGLFSVDAVSYTHLLRRGGEHRLHCGGKAGLGTLPPHFECGGRPQRHCAGTGADLSAQI